MSNVHKLTSCPIPGEVNEALAEALRDLLARVERGEIVSMAWAHYTGTPADIIGTGWEAAGGTGFQTHSAIATLAHRFAQHLLDD